MQIAQAQNQSLWKQVYQDAVFELDHGHLRPKLEAARKAIETGFPKCFLAAARTVSSWNSAMPSARSSI